MELEKLSPLPLANAAQQDNSAQDNSTDTTTGVNGAPSNGDDLSSSGHNGNDSDDGDGDGS